MRLGLESTAYESRAGDGAKIGLGLTGRKRCVGVPMLVIDSRSRLTIARFLTSPACRPGEGGEPPIEAAIGTSSEGSPSGDASSGGPWSMTEATSEAPEDASAS